MKNIKTKDWYIILIISLPIFLQSILFSARNLVDVFLLGGLGENEVAAMGAACRYMILATVIMFAVAKSSSQKMSRRYGEDNFESLKDEFSTLIFSMLPVSAIIGIVFAIFPQYLISISTTNQEIIELGAEYLRIVSVQLIFTSIVIALSLALRVVHKPQISTNCSAFNISLNVVLTYILVSGDFMPSMGIFGAALSTVISSVLEFFIVVIYIHKRNDNFKFYIPFESLRDYFSKDKVINLLKFSIPMIVSGFLYSFAMLAYVSIFGRIGEVEQASISIMFSLESILLGLAIGISQGTGVVVGNVLGAKNLDRLKNIINTAFTLGIFACLISSGIIYLTKYDILSFFNGMSLEAIGLTISMMGFLSITILLRGMSIILYNGILRAGGDNKFCMNVDLITIWIIVVPLIFILSDLLSPLALFVFLYVEDIIKILIGMYRIRNDKWIKNI